MEVSGRGELQLAILIENMRREGFELSMSRPRVVLTKDENGETLEPIEDVVIDVDEEFSGVVIEKMTERKAEMIDMRPSGRQPPASGVLRADPRPDRLPGRVPDRHPGHGDHEPPVPRLRALQGRDRTAAATAC